LYRFNENGMKTGVEGFNEQNTVTSKSSHIYDENGKIKKDIYYGAQGEVLVTLDYFYDNNGNKIKEIKNDRIGNFMYTSLWTYDANGNATNYIRSISGNNRNSILTNVETSYDKNGNITGETTTEYKNDNSILFKRITQYNTLGEKLTRVEYDGNGTLTKKETYTYNRWGKPATYIYNTYQPDTKKWKKTTSTYTYDKKGNLLESKEPWQTLRYTYDKNGNEIEVFEYNESGVLQKKNTGSYDDKNNKKEEINIIFSEDGSIDHKYKYTYDEAGRLIEWAKYDNKGNLLYTYRTLYDARGNKTEEVEESTVKIPKIKYQYKFDKKDNLIETKCYRLSDRDEPSLAMIYEYEIIYWEE